MCGRFTHKMSWSELVRLYQLSLDLNPPRNTEARYNICPTDQILYCRLKDGQRVVREASWWLVPPWAKERPKYAMINARVEEVATKPSWKDSFAARRCLIPADGYYEWTIADDKGKDPWYFHIPDGSPFSFAGIYAYNHKLNVTTCAIITSPPVPPVEMIHDRMPVALAEEAYDAWLDPKSDVETALDIVRERHINGQMTVHRVDRQVNSNKWQGGPETIAPIDL
ncbi:SOS response-associated peptidase [Devosia nitrariae]|uniref:Abasic site processing protein n=1 Tax=Devosia nitrariae TaxID=2071872 RepID=A0ABQ5W0N6_9HYPH|nr:SOS response-associated peptidase [Devosia nitrariae]GLQ53630.1 DUF159 family protein [Devosia nitrariae]